MKKLHGFRAARYGGNTGTRDVDEAKRPHEVHELVDLGWRAGDLEDETGMRRIHDMGAEDFGQAHGFGALVAGAGYLYQRHLALNPGSGGRPVYHRMHRHETTQ